MPLELQLAILAGGSLIVGILSGISGGGAGLIMVPLSIAVGLPAQVAIATTKMNALGSAFGGLSVFWKSGHVRKDILKVMAPIGLVIALSAPFVFSVINADVFQRIVGIILILVAPTLFIKRKNIKPNRGVKSIGYVLYSGILALAAYFGSGVGALATFVLTLVFGTTKLEANATKRAVTAIIVPVTFAGLLAAGYVSIWHGLALLVGSFIGTQLGSKIAIKKGEQFVTYAMAALAILSGVLLLIP